MNSSISKKYVNKNKDLLLKKYKRFISIYRASCNEISQMRVISYAYYLRHMKKLIVLLHFIHQIYRITFKKDMPQINMFDAHTMRRYGDAEKKYDDFVYFSTDITPINIITRVEDSKIIPISYYNYNMPANPQFILKFSHSQSQSQSYSMGGGGDYKEYYEKLLYSTILHRCIRLTFKGNKMIFNGEHESKYTDSIANNLEYAKYMSILPSHITLNIVDFAEDDKDIIPFFGDNIRGILQSINLLHQGFQEDYEIIHDNKGYEKQLNDIKGYSDDNTIKTILYTINNNNNNIANIYKNKGDKDKGDYYYWFKYNSPLPAITILDTDTYISGIHTFQPLHITPNRLLNIQQFYIGSQEPFSRIVNSALQNYIANGVVMENAAYKRVRYLLKFCSEARYNATHNKKTIYVFHGTRKDFHSYHNKDLVLTSFLSCTFNINIALKYAYENHKNNGSVYILEIKDDIYYINFNDELYQIILQPGSRILVVNTLEVGGVKYNLCKVHNTPKEYMEILYNNIFEGGKRTQFNIKNFKIHEEKSKYPTAIAGAIAGAIDHDITYICLGAQINEDMTPNTYFNVKYTLHQHFICECYKFFNINVIDYAIYYYDDAGISGTGGGAFYTGYKNDTNYEPINMRSREYGRFNYNFDNLFIDSLLHNDDVLYPQNYMKNTRRRFDYRLSSFRSVGLFDYEGYKKINFNIHEPPSASLKYIDILREYISGNEDRNNLFINDVTRDYMKLVISNNINYLRDFRDNFVDMLRDNYIDFIGVNMKIDNTTEEYSDLVEMFKELAQNLKKTADYYVINMENGNIYKEVEPFIYDRDMKIDATVAAVVGGKVSTISKRATVNAKKYANDVNAAKSTKHTSVYSKTMKDMKMVATDEANANNNNKGYVMPYDDFVKVINKFRILK
jgi:hypothetical protein